MKELIGAVIAINGHLNLSPAKVEICQQLAPEWVEELRICDYYDESVSEDESIDFETLNHSKCYSRSHSKCPGHGKSHGKTTC